MLYTQLVYGTIIITVVVIFHVVSLVFLVRLLKRWHDIYALFDRLLGGDSWTRRIRFFHYRHSYR